MGPLVPQPAGSPKTCLVCPPMSAHLGGLGSGASSQGTLCPHGDRRGLAARAVCQCARHRAISQHVPAWYMVVSVLLQKGNLLAPKETAVPMSPCPPTYPWQQPTLWHCGEQREGAHKANLPQHPVSHKSCPLVPGAGAQQWDSNTSPQLRKLTLAAMPLQPPSTTH